jgi:hypothetical protein
MVIGVRYSSGSIGVFSGPVFLGYVALLPSNCLPETRYDRKSSCHSPGVSGSPSKRAGGFGSVCEKKVENRGERNGRRQSLDVSDGERDADSLVEIVRNAVLYSVSAIASEYR